ncbi:MAG TPA: hypothetical protein ENK57_09595 [Polyangiaceae bacterium]|nr:hypothetical protein [Polyangiaceae bacterium]
MASISDTDRVVYGAALVVALLAAGIAVMANLDDDGAPTEEIDPVAAARERSERERPTGSIEFTTPPESGGEPASAETSARRDFVPDLPEVPDLEAEPPPPRPATEEDPRMRSLGAEMRVLSRARELLGQHPAEALGVIEQHRRQYPLGVLREEREAFAVEALLALEHPAEAERRYYDFLESFPRSDHREHLRQAMLRPPHRVGASGR